MKKLVFIIMLGVMLTSCASKKNVTNDTVNDTTNDTVVDTVLDTIQ